MWAVCHMVKGWKIYKHEIQTMSSAYSCRQGYITWVLRSRVAEMCATELSPLVEHAIEPFIAFSQSPGCGVYPSCLLA